VCDGTIISVCIVIYLWYNVTFERGGMRMRYHVITLLFQGLLFVVLHHWVKVSASVVHIYIFMCFLSLSLSLLCVKRSWLRTQLLLLSVRAPVVHNRQMPVYSLSHLPSTMNAIIRFIARVMSFSVFVWYLLL